MAAYGLRVEEGGLVEILDGSSHLITHSCFGDNHSLLDGTFDCNNELTSFNRGNFQIGKVNTTNYQSTGRFRTQTAYLPLVETPRAFDANFFGRNSTWGGTVEYYGGGTINLPTIDTRWTYYDLEVNNVNLNLGSIPYVDVVGNLYLDGGYIDINQSQLQLRGSVDYSNGGYIRTRPTSELCMFGKQSPSISTDDYSLPGMTTYQISTQGTDNVSVLYPQLRLSNSTVGFTNGNAAELQRLRIDREDVVHLRADLEVNNLLELDRGKLRTYDSEGSIVYVSNTDSGAVTHFTTKYTSVTYGYVSGTLRRAVVPNTSYDFPVGYPDADDFAGANHRRISLDVNAMSGYTDLEVNFVRNADDCDGLLTEVEDGVDYTAIHPEGKWEVRPTGAGSIDYNARLYTWGFDETLLLPNRYGPLKRAIGSVSCPDWSKAGGSRPPLGGLGRVVLKESTIDTSYAGRLGWTGFSEMAIGIQETPPLAIEGLQQFEATVQPDDAVLLTWQLNANKAENYSEVMLERSADGHRFETLATGLKPLTQHLDVQPMSGKNFYRLVAEDYDGEQQRSEVELAVFHTDNRTHFWMQNPHDAQAGKLQVNYASPVSQSVQAQLMDVTGREMLSTPVDMTAGEGQFELNTTNLSSGVYLLQITGSDVQLQQKLVIE